MKRFIIVSALCFAAATASAQQTLQLDASEDTTDVITINDIVNQQEEVTTRLANERHYASVWGRPRFFNISKNSSRLSPKEDIETDIPSYNDGKVPEFKTNWGFSIQFGRDYRLHKKPIGNTLQFYIDYVGIDLNVNHYKAEDAPKLYNSTNKELTIHNKGEHKDENFWRTPWMLEKYEFNYGMLVGPSMTIAPFNYVKGAPGLHHLRMNFFFHIGYHASILWMKNDSDKDVNTYSTNAQSNFRVMEKNLKMDWGHGLIHSFGFSFTWKMIGFGYEHRVGSVKYKSLNTGDFGNNSYKFNTTTNRIFLQFRLGK